MKWLPLRLESLISMYGGGTPSKQNPSFWKGDIPWVSPKDMSVREIHDSQDHITQEAVEKSTTQLVPAGSVLVVVRSGILVRKIPIGIAQRPLAINQDMKALVPNQGVLDSRFLSYLLESKQQVLLSNYVKRGATVHSLQIDKLKKMIVQLPPMSEQRRIVEVLGEADALRRKRAEADAKSGRILPALFSKMFGDPTTNPKRWPTERLGHLFDMAGGGTPSKSVTEYWNGDIPWVSPKDMKCDVVLDTEDQITLEAIRSSATRLVNQGAILVVYRSGILAHSFPVAFAGRDLTINQDLKALSSKGEVSNEYLYGLLSAVPTIGLSCVKKGATVHNVDGTRFLSLDIATPPEQLQKSFGVRLEELLRFKTKRESASALVEDLFAVLLHRAFSGNLTAKWREAHMMEILSEMEEQAKMLNISEHLAN
jgi:type I restriction enzyme, S subunit